MPDLLLKIMSLMRIHTNNCMKHSQVLIGKEKNVTDNKGGFMESSLLCCVSDILWYVMVLDNYDQLILFLFKILTRIKYQKLTVPSFHNTHT